MTAPQSVGVAKADDGAISDQDKVSTTQHGPLRGESPSGQPQVLVPDADEKQRRLRRVDHLHQR